MSKGYVIDRPNKKSIKLTSIEEIVSAAESNNILREQCFCIDCGNLIIGYDGYYYTDDGLLKCTSKYTFKRVYIYNNHLYRMCRCPDCVKKLCKEYDYYKTIRPFANYCKYIYNVSDEDFNAFVSERQRNSETKMIKKYGEVEGHKRWKNYCRSIAVTLEQQIKLYGVIEGTKRYQEYCLKQAESNTYEYKNKKYGMTKKEFKEYNLSRAITLQNQIKKYGEEEGLKRYQEYCNKQRYSCSPNYFIEKYGIEDGLEKYNKFDNARSIFVIQSNIALELLSHLYEYYKDNANIFWFGNKEYEVYLQNKNYYKVDYYDQTRNIVVEFYGNYWHSDKLYDGKVNDDLYRMNEIIKTLRCKFIIVWENSYKSDKTKVIEQIKECIDNYKNIDNIIEI